MVSDKNISEKDLLSLYIDQPGSWVTKEYLQDILQNYTKDRSFKIKKLKFTPVTAKGENYGGVITRAEIEYKNETNFNTKTINVVIKTAFEDDKFAIDVLKDFDVFNREMRIYNDILPNLNRLLKEADINEFLFPETIKIDFENFTIIFEDLRSKQFQTVNRLNGLDFKHAKISLQKLAKMHAAAAVLNEKNPKVFENGYNSGFFTRETDSYNNFFITILKACIEIIYEDFDQSYHMYAKKMQSLLPDLIELGRKCFDSSSDQFNTFIHGDIWQSNLMFKYSPSSSTELRKKIHDAVIIDFQFCCWSSAIIDLQYFFNIALEETVKRNNQEDLLKCYYETFSKSLKKLKFNGSIPTLNEFYINFLKKDFYGFIVTCINQPIALSETPEVDFHAVHGTSEHAVNCKRLMFKNKRIQENLKYWLPIFNEKGLFDITVNTINNFKL